MPPFLKKHGTAILSVLTACFAIWQSCTPERVTVLPKPDTVVHAIPVTHYIDRAPVVVRELPARTVYVRDTVRVPVAITDSTGRTDTIVAPPFTVESRDTITPQGDTLAARFRYPELTFDFELRPSPDSVTVLYRDTTITVTVEGESGDFWTSLGWGAGGVAIGAGLILLFGGGGGGQ